MDGAGGKAAGRVIDVGAGRKTVAVRATLPGGLAPLRTYKGAGPSISARDEPIVVA